MILISIITVLFVCYGILIFYYWQSWRSIAVFTAPAPNRPLPVSIIIPARNEEENIGRLLKALEQQNYPRELVEVIVIDDHSTDNTAGIVSQFSPVKLLKLTKVDGNSYKKKAIETGIAAATHDIIVSTDADCIPPVGWLQLLVAFKEQTNAGFIVAPVVFNCNSSPLQVFQAMDFMVLQGITGAAVAKKLYSMCNGANLAYEKNLFYDVGGFSGIDHIASGDDMLLMDKIARKYPNRIHYLKSAEAMVGTQPMQTWREFFNQRIRWASKAVHYDNKKIIGVLLLVYLFNLSFLVLFVAGFWNNSFWITLLIAWLLKTLAELPFFYSVTQFFNKRWAVNYFFVFQPLHIFYTILSGLLGQLGKYEWKGRRVR